MIQQAVIKISLNMLLPKAVLASITISRGCKVFVKARADVTFDSMMPLRPAPEVTSLRVADKPFPLSSTTEAAGGCKRVGRWERDAGAQSEEIRS
jgi:hypothetical protein